MTITQVQQTFGSNAASALSITATFGAGATAGNILWCAFAGDKNAGTITGPSGFTTLFNNSATSVSIWVGYKVAAGGETGLTLSHTSGNVSGDIMWIGEYSDSNSGTWTIYSSATNYNAADAVNSSPVSCGTAADPVSTCAALAFQAIDSHSNYTSGGAWTNSFTTVQEWDSARGAGTGSADMAVAIHNPQSGGGTVSTSHSWTGGGDQISAAIATFGKFNADATPTPTTIARSVVIPSMTFLAPATATPAVIAQSVAIPAPTVTTGTPATPTPAVIARSVVIPAPTLVLPDARPLPSAIARAVVIPAPVVQINHTVSVAAIARTAVLPAPTVVTVATATPAAITRPVAIPAPNVDVVSAAPVHLLTETFSHEDTGKWTGYPSSNVFATLGRLNISPLTNSMLGLTSISNFSLNNDEVYAEVPQVPNVGNGGTFAQLSMDYATNNSLAVLWANGNMVFRERVAGVNNDTTLTYNSVSHRWWKIGKTGTTVVWSTSPDGITWTTRRTKTTALNPNTAKVILAAGYGGTEPSPGSAQFDNLNTQAIVVTPTAAPVVDTGWWLQVYDLMTGQLQARVMDFSEASILDGVSEEGVGTVSISRSVPSISAFNSDGSPNILPNGLPATSLIERAYYWVAYDHGVPRFRFIADVNDKVTSKSNDNEDGVTFSGKGHATVLSWGTTLPANLSIAAKSRIFLQTNWAHVWLTLFNEAQNRGAIPLWVTPTFDEFIDSNGVAWVDFGDYEVKPGTDMLALLTGFQSNIGFQWHMDVNGFLTVAMDFGVDRSSTVRFFEQHDIWEAEDHLVGSDVKSDIYVERGDGFISSATDTATRAEWGHRELYFQASGALGDFAGDIYATGTLSQLKKPVFERNFKVDPYPTDDSGVSLGRRVYVDYGPGDFIGYNAKDGTGSTDFRLLTIAIKFGGKDGPTVDEEIVVNSRREAYAERIKRILSQSLGGNYSAANGGPNDLTGGSTALQEAVGDTSVPGTMPALSGITSASTMADNGIEQAQVTLTWVAPALNTDATLLVDGDHYDIGYRILGAADYEVLTVGWDTNQLTIDGLTPNTSYQFRIRAVDKANPTNYGDWSTPTTYLTIIDTTAPPTPAVPSCATSLIAVQITHTMGISTGGTYNLPTDMDHFEVHAGTVFNFSPSPSTLIGKLQANKANLTAGIPAIGTFPLSATTLTYFKVIAVDRTGNRSAASGSASATATLIDNAHISDLTATKITAGTISVAIILTGSIKTGTSGARAEMDSSGIRLYNSGGGNTVNLDATTGNAAITGTFQTSSSGQRIFIDAGGNGTIWFYPSTGTDYAFINAPAQNSVGVNSGNGGGTNSTRMWANPTYAELLYMVQATQAISGGRVFVQASLAQLEHVSGCKVWSDNTQSGMAYPSGATFTVDINGGTFTGGSGDTLDASISGGASFQLGNGWDVTAKSGDQAKMQVASGASLTVTTGAAFAINSGSTFNVNVTSGASLQVGNGVQGTAKSGDNVTFNVSGGASMSVSGNNVSLSGSGTGTFHTTGNMDVASTGSGSTSIFGATNNRYIFLDSLGNASLINNSVSVSLSTTTCRISCTAFQSAGIVSTALSPTMYYDVSSWQIYYSTSSRLVKEQIEDADQAALLRDVKKLRPVTFYDKRQWNEAQESGDDSKLSQQLGLIAEEVGELSTLGKLLVEQNVDQDGNVLPPGLSYSRGWIALVPWIREVEESIRRIEGKLDSLRPKGKK